MKENFVGNIPSTYIQDKALAERVAYQVKPLRDEAEGIRRSRSQMSYLKFLKRGRLRERAQVLDNRASKTEDLFLVMHKVGTDKNIQHFMHQPADAAIRRGQRAIAHDIHAFAATTPEEYIDNQGRWVNTSPVVQAVIEIAKVSASAHKTKKEFTLSGSKLPVYDFNPLLHAVRGEEYLDDKGVKDPNLVLVEDLYNLIGLEDHVGSIPDMPGFSRFLGKVEMTDARIPKLGVDLEFNFFGAREGMSAEETYVLPAHIDIIMRKNENK